MQKPTQTSQTLLERCTKTKKPSGKQQIQKKTKEHQKLLGKTKTTVFKGFRLTLGCVFFVLLFFGFPEGFYKTNKSLEKTKNTKENQRKQKQQEKPKKKCF